eukprot:TRINITY_DN963_c0_g1_i1.p1 TRINITY_DN963_c0_g1~~TRINITY_DN963_c0_g1_i1.p1  ORF type:complete len:744 (-),score=226.90 TRINITY_DN963_c0_g1_i1:66-2297(-)
MSQNLPQEGKRNVLITSALPYVNNVPHLGNIIGCVLSADVFARYCRLRGHNVLYICGTDEYGTATETKAMEEGVTPQQICDKYHVIHAEIYKWFGCSFDHFGRTTTKQQTDIAQDIFLKLHKKEFVYEDEIEQLYCSGCDSFLADRYVEGTCPHCAYEDARGDQCDVCGKLLNPTELKDPKCKRCRSKTGVPPPEVRKTQHLFLDLPKLKDPLESWFKGTSAAWSANSQQITSSWLKDLKGRCITRDLKWGTPVPLERFKNKVFYVWFDAPIGYLSITANYTTEWEKWWKNPDQVELFQFMGKDNIPFHTVMFPSCLLGTGDPYTLLKTISTTEYLNYEGGKFSKSRNTGVFGNDAIKSGIPVEYWRFYLLMIRPETSDSVFKWDDFAAKINDELLKNVGNFINRALKFISSNFGNKIPGVTTLTEAEEKLFEKISEQLVDYIKAMEAVSLKEGLRIAMGISQLGNQYFQANQPWELVKTDQNRCKTVVNVGANLSHLLATLLEPYVPSLSEKIFKQLKSQPQQISEKFNHLALLEGHELGDVQPLIQKLDDKVLQVCKATYGSSETMVAPVFPLDLRVGHIHSVEDHPQADNLYVCKIDVGKDHNPKGEEGPYRQVIAGLKNFMTKEELTGKQVVVICNLKPMNLKSVKSCGMLVCAEQENKMQLVQIKGKQEPGTQVLPTGGAKTKVQPVVDKKDFQKVNMSTVKDGSLVFSVKDKKFPLVSAADNTPVIAEGFSEGAKIK